eukprot:gene19763-biopygen20047
MLISLGVAGFQGRVAEECRQWRQVFVFFGVFERAGGADQFLKVFYPGLAFLAFFRFVVGDQAGLLDHGLGHQVQGHFHALGGQVLDQLDKHAQGTGRTAGQALVGDQQAHRFPHRHIAVACVVANRLDGLLADATGRNVDHPFQRRIVAATFQQAQVGHGVLDFGTFEEALATIDAIRNALAQQGLFQYP